jgi:hypothetical protein
MCCAEALGCSISGTSTNTRGAVSENINRIIHNIIIFYSFVYSSVILVVCII